MAKKKRKVAKKVVKKSNPNPSQQSSSIKKNTKSSTGANYTTIGILLALLGAVLYFNTLGHDYAFDDFIVITGNEFTQKGFAGIYDLMTRDFFEGIYGEQGMNLTGGRYRPLSLVMFAIEYQFFGDNPAAGHWINVILYAVTGGMLFHVMRNWLNKIEGGTVMAFIATLLFVVHPIHTEVVANIKSRDEILGILLLLVALHGLYKYIEEGAKNWYPIALGSFFLAMLSKESAFTYVAMIPLALFVLRKMTPSDVVKYTVPLVVVAGAYLALRTGMLWKEPIPGMEIPAENPDIMENPFVNADMATKLATIGVILLNYFLLLILPHPMSCDYSFNQIPYTSFSDPLALLGWGIYIGMGIYAAIRIWKRDVIALGILLYLAPLSLVTNLVFNIGAPMADRFLYAPSLGFCLIVAYLLVHYGQVLTFEALKKKLPIVGLLLVIVIASSFKTITRNKDWYDNTTLFTKDRLAVPNSAKIHYYYANSLLKDYLASHPNPAAPTPQGLVLLDSIEAGFLRSYEINQKFHHSTYNIGLVNIYKRNAQEALKWLNYTLELQPNHGISHEQLVRVYGELLNNPDKALEHLNIVLSTVEGQKHASNYQHLGILNAMKGNAEAAEKAFVQAATMDPSSAKGCYGNLAGMYSNMLQVAQRQGDAQKVALYTQKAQQYQQLAQ